MPGTLVNISPMETTCYIKHTWDEGSKKWVGTPIPNKYEGSYQQRKDQQFLQVLEAQPDPDVKALIDAMTEFWSACGTERMCIPCFNGAFNGSRGCCSGCANSSTTGCIGKGVFCTTFTCDRIIRLIPPEVRKDFTKVFKHCGSRGIEHWWARLRHKYRPYSSELRDPNTKKWEGVPHAYFVEGFLHDSAIRLDDKNRTICRRYIKKLNDMTKRVRESEWKPDMVTLYQHLGHKDHKVKEPWKIPLDPWMPAQTKAA